MSRNAVYPGTFDPITNGHQDLVRRAAGIFDRVVVAIAANTNKTPMFSLEQRVSLARQVLKRCAQRGSAGLYRPHRGFRASQWHQRHRARVARGVGLRVRVSARHHVAASFAGVETVFLTPQEQFTFISSTLVREIATFGGDVSEFVHPIVAAELKKMKQA